MIKRLFSVIMFLFVSFSALGQSDIKYADQLFQASKYAEAKREYEIHNMNPHASKRIKQSDECLKLLIIADYLYSNDRKYDAKAKYEELLTINPSDSMALVRIKELENFTETEIIHSLCINNDDSDKEEIVDDNSPFIIVEEMPQFEGGNQLKFRSWASSQLQYPQIAMENGIQGRVTAEFVIDRDGSLINIKILNSPDRSLSEEVINVLSSSPRWKPGKQRMVPVRVRFTLPFDFRLSDSNSKDDKERRNTNMQY